MGTENEYIRDRNMELQSKVLWLQGELDGLLRTLEYIRSLNSLGKTREITDEIINPILKHYNR
jgi:hypothetical protein